MKKLLMICCALVGCLFFGTNSVMATPNYVSGDAYVHKLRDHVFATGCTGSQNLCQIWYADGSVDIMFKIPGGYDVLHLTPTKAETPPQDPHADPGIYLKEPVTQEWFYSSQQLDTTP